MSADKCGMCGQPHWKTHSFAEMLRYEIREDPDQVPEEHRPAIVRDIYRSLLGKTEGGRFVLDQSDGEGQHSIDEVLGSVETYRLWRTANACRQGACKQHQTS